MSLQAGLDALKQGRNRDAVQILKQFCQYYTQAGSKEYIQAQMGLVKAYHRNGETEKAIALAKDPTTQENPQVSGWAQQVLQTLTGNTMPQQTTSSTSEQPSPVPKAGRAAQVGVKLPLAGVAGNLALASFVTISLLFGMVFVLSLALVFIIGSDNPTTGLAISVAITLIFNVAAFFLSPFLLDLTHDR